MDMENMTNEEFLKQLEEFVREWCEYYGTTQTEPDSKRQADEDTAGNPRGAGGYHWTRSAADSEYMMLGCDAKHDASCNRWFEYIGCGYATWRDGKYLQEADDMDIDMFHEEHPGIVCRESFYDFEYGNTRDEVAHVIFILLDYIGSQYRTCSFSLNDIDLDKVKEYAEMLEAWHRTGEWNAEAFEGSPQFGPWRER